jgi:serine/threonine protein kinase
MIMTRIPAHPNIANIIDSKVGPITSFIMMQYAPGVTVRDWVNVHIIDDHIRTNLWHIFGQTLVNAVLFLHKHDVVHNDLNNGNVMVNPENGCLTIVDFGAACVPDSKDVPCQNIAHLEFSAPETGTQDLHSWDEMRAIDAYGVGSLLYLWYYGVPPFSEREMNSRKLPIASHNFHLKGIEDVPITLLIDESKEACIMYNLLRRKPKFRWSLEQIPRLSDKVWTCG